MYLEDFRGEDEEEGEAVRQGGQPPPPPPPPPPQARSGWFIVCPYCLEQHARGAEGGGGPMAATAPYVSNRVNNVKRHIWKMHEAAREAERGGGGGARR